MGSCVRNYRLLNYGLNYIAKLKCCIFYDLLHYSVIYLIFSPSMVIANNVRMSKGGGCWRWILIKYVTIIHQKIKNLYTYSLLSVV